MQLKERRTINSPQMPVYCADCQHAVDTSFASLSHCVVGPRSEIRERLLSRLCAEFTLRHPEPLFGVGDD